MVLSNGYGQHWLHVWSAQAMQHHKTTFESSILAASGRHLSQYSRRYLASHPSARGRDPLEIPDFTQFSDGGESSARTLIPSPALFTFGALDPAQLRDHTRLPTIAECATHLELLHAFYAIRKKVLSSAAWNKALGIEPETTTAYRTDRSTSYDYRGYRNRTVPVRKYKVVYRDETFAVRGKEKWPFYLNLAAVRFLYWAEAVARYVPPEPADATVHLPPLDVLMVWHALLLNPAWFNSFENNAVKQLHGVPFPWQDIHEAIDTDRADWPFKQSAAASQWFKDHVSLEADLYEDIASETKSERITDLLKRQGASRDDSSTPRGITVEEIDEEILNDKSAGRDPDREYLICLHEVVTKANEDPIKGLVEAAQRQSLFVDKMEKQLWIRSPAFKGTLERAIARYRRFLQLFKLYPGKMLVPTLDIDLVWHTHQLSPFLYKAGTNKYAGRTIDHNDKLGKPTLDDGFTRTKELYRIRFAQEYNVCTCWDCEALLSAAEGNWNSDEDIDEGAIAKLLHQNIAYHRAVEVARRKATAADYDLASAAHLPKAESLQRVHHSLGHEVKDIRPS